MLWKSGMAIEPPSGEAWAGLLAGEATIGVQSDSTVVTGAYLTPEGRICPRCSSAMVLGRPGAGRMSGSSSGGARRSRSVEARSRSRRIVRSRFNKAVRDVRLASGRQLVRLLLGGEARINPEDVRTPGRPRPGVRGGPQLQARLGLFRTATGRWARGRGSRIRPLPPAPIRRCRACRPRLLPRRCPASRWPFPRL